MENSPKCLYYLTLIFRLLILLLLVLFIPEILGSKINCEILKRNWGIRFNIYLICAKQINILIEPAPLNFFTSFKFIFSPKKFFKKLKPTLASLDSGKVG
ncbi:hypothetical protein SIXOD_v1c14490 [Spiroplasma ixodetis Y32]|nr:hypothetical protein SIXOD_v1c14490 [Spiroplasma ixodetis Y32]